MDAGWTMLPWIRCSFFPVRLCTLLSCWCSQSEIQSLSPNTARSKGRPGPIRIEEEELSSLGDTRIRRSEPSRAAVSTRPLRWSHQNRRSSVKSMARPLGDTRRTANRQQEPKPLFIPSND